MDIAIFLHGDFITTNGSLEKNVFLLLEGTADIININNRRTIDVK